MASETEATAGVRTPRVRTPRVTVYFAVVTVLLGVAVIAGIAVGSSPIAATVVARVLASHFLPAGWIDLSDVTDAERIIVWLVRLPRVLVAASVGASLAVAGVQMQALFRNPLASPDVIGASTGGSLGAVIALATGLAARSIFYMPVLSFAGSLLALVMVHLIATQRGRTPIASLLLAGIALNSLFGAATSFLITASWVRYEVAEQIVFWLMGGLDSRTWEHVGLVVPCFVVGLLLSIPYARDLDVMLLGEDAALSMGIDVEHLKRLTMAAAALLTGGAVAVSGVVGFVGLIVPHIVRLAIGPTHRSLLPASALTGALFLIVSDILARTIVPPQEIRLGIVTAIFGAPFFLYLLMRANR